MTVRCKDCNKVHSFRNYRGNKLSDHKCECGGSLEMLGGIHLIAGKHPFDDSRTHTSKWYEGDYFHADRNKKGEYYIIHNGYYHPVENAVLAKNKQPITQT